jgi:hypothetical protein
MENLIVKLIKFIDGLSEDELLALSTINNEDNAENKKLVDIINDNILLGNNYLKCKGLQNNSSKNLPIHWHISKSQSTLLPSVPEELHLLRFSNLRYETEASEAYTLRLGPTPSKGNELSGKQTSEGKTIKAQL